MDCVTTEAQIHYHSSVCAILTGGSRHYHYAFRTKQVFFFFFFPGKDSPVAMSREDLARDLWIHCTSRTKQLGLPYPSETTSFGDYIIQ